MVTLKFSAETTFKEKDLIKFLDYSMDNDMVNNVKESEPTEFDAEAKSLCKGLISRSLLESSDWDDITPTEHNGFNELKSKMEYYLSLKCNNPKMYEKLRDELGGD